MDPEEADLRDESAICGTERAYRSSIKEIALDNPMAFWNSINSSREMTPSLFRSNRSKRLSAPTSPSSSKTARSSLSDTSPSPLASIARNRPSPASYASEASVDARSSHIFCSCTSRKLFVCDTVSPPL